MGRNNEDIGENRTKQKSSTDNLRKRTINRGFE